MDIQPYEVLSQFYDETWAGFSVQYIEFLSAIMEQSNMTRAEILDLGCGTGILAAALGELGHRVHGVDRSAAMIARAEVNAEHLDSVTFSVGDMETFVAPDRYSLVTCVFDALNYLTREEALHSMFRSVARAMRDNGLFVFDFNTHRMYLGHQGQEIQRDVNGVKFVQRLTYDEEKRLATTIFDFGNKKEIHYQRAYMLKEVQGALSQVGLGIVDVFSDLDGTLYRPDMTRRVYVTAAHVL